LLFDLDGRSAVLRIAFARLSRAAGLAASLLAAACSPGGGTEAGPASGAAPEPVIEVRTLPVRRGTIAQRIRAPASLEARRESRIGPEVQGTLVRIFVDEGDRVEAGAPLFQIDPDPYEFALRQAEAGQDLARAQRLQVEADLARARALSAQRVIAPQEIEKLETALAVARATERQAAEAVALVRHKLAQTLVSAPYGASVVARLADEGTTALVQPQTIVLVLQESDALEARAAIPESHLALVRVGDAARIRVEGLPAPIETRVSAVADTLDLATRTYSVRMPVPNPDHSLKAGVFAEVELLPQPKRDALVVPRDAIRSDDGRARVFTVREGVATPVGITVGIVSEEEAEVLQGLDADMEVIVGEAAAQIAPGMRVRSARGDAP
jgi:membrane fusion protein (multidrug efflux system)